MNKYNLEINDTVASPQFTAYNQVGDEPKQWKAEFNPSSGLLQHSPFHSTHFSPHRLLHNGHLQTALAMVKPDAEDAYYVDQPILVDAGPDYCDATVVAGGSRRTKLLAYYTPCRTANRHGLVLMLHGWLGCSHSNYNRVTTLALTKAGFDVVRLNLRDHGPDYHLQTHQLNPGIFLGILIEEAHYAAQQLALLANGQPFYIVGVSMGGNFALRMALRHAEQPLPNLRKIIAINPAINPATATDNVDRFPLYRRYFRRRWLESLLTKQKYFPELYNFEELRTIPTIRGITERVIRRYGTRFGDFRTANEYFAQYAVLPSALEKLTVPTVIITAEDDPIIDVQDFGALPLHQSLDFQLHPTGGHVGYVSLFPTQHYLPQAVLGALTE